MQNHVVQQSLVALWLLLLLVLPIELQTLEAPQERRTMAVNVLGQNGRQVQNLSPANFRGKLGQKDVKIVSVTLDNQPRRIVILLDVSGSMTSSRSRWNLAYRAAWDIIALAPAESSLALLVFAETVEDTVELTQEREAVLQRLSALGPDYRHPKTHSRTALRDALVAAIELLETPRLGDAIYLITDAGDNFSRIKSGRTKQALLCAGTRFYAFLLLGSGERLTPYEKSHTSLIEEWLQATGGEAVVLRSTSAFTAQYKLNDKRQAQVAAGAFQLYYRMGEFYRLEVELPRALRKPRGWKLEVVDEHGEKRKDLKVIYPRRLAACPVENPGN